MKNVSGPVNHLALKYQAPAAMVERLLHEETKRITAQARVTTFVPIIAARRVEERLRNRAEFGLQSESEPAEAAA